LSEEHFVYVDNITKYPDCTRIGIPKTKGGSLLLNLMLDFVKKYLKPLYGLKYIQLRDTSHLWCEKSKINIDFDSFYMLTHGDTWYGKYGFIPFDINTNKIDQIKLKHLNVNKVFSTILLFGITFLQGNRDFSIGIDGSDDIRAYLYHRMFRHNIEHLSHFLSIIGVDWYVKLLRNRLDIERDDNGIPLFKPRPETFDMNRKSNDLYRYYIFTLQ